MGLCLSQFRAGSRHRRLVDPHAFPHLYIISLADNDELAMLYVEVQTPSPEPARPATLADLSRNASVISSSSSSSSTSSLVANTPRSRPVRAFSAPRSLSREAPSTPRASRPPAYLAREFGLANGDDDLTRRAQSRSKSRTKSRNSSVGVKAQLDDFEFGEELGEGSYSTVRAIRFAHFHS